MSEYWTPPQPPHGPPARLINAVFHQVRKIVVLSHEKICTFMSMYTNPVDYIFRDSLTNCRDTTLQFWEQRESESEAVKDCRMMRKMNLLMVRAMFLSLNQEYIH